VDDFVVNVRQIAQYPLKSFLAPDDTLLIQSDGVGGPYQSMLAAQLVSTALSQGGWLLLTTGNGIAWNDRATFIFDGSAFQFDNLVNVPELNATEGGLFDHGERVATFAHFEWLAANSVTSVNNRTGHVQIEEADILRAGAAPVHNPHFSGWCTAPTFWDTRSSDDTIATTAWVQQHWCDAIAAGVVVTSFNGRGGAVLLTADDVTFACTAVGAQPRANTPPAGDASNRIATTAFVDGGLTDLQLYVDQELQGLPTAAELALFAPIDSPQFVGVPTAPTANPGSSTGQLATTAFVHAAVVASTSGVATFNTRTGAVVLIGADITAAGGALLVSPAFTGNPTAPTQAPGDNATHVATTAFVHAAVAAVVSGGVLSFNTRTGAVSLTLADVTGTGVLASPALTGVPTAPTATTGTSTTQVATCAFVENAIATVVGVASFNGRTGAVSLQGSDVSAAGGALINSPSFTGAPAAPTAVVGTNTTQLATCQFVLAQIASGSNVVSFNGRGGAVTLNASDISGAGGAILNSPAFTGTPTAPTPTVGDNSAKIATTAFVISSLAASGVSSFNTRTGAVVLALADITAAGGAPLASPALTGSPTVPTAAPGTSTTQAASTAFVAAAITAGAVASFNGRTGAVNLIAADVSAAGGALLASPNFTGTPQAPTASPGTSSGQLATTAFVAAAMAGGAGVVTFNTRAGAVTLLAADITSAGGALLASPTFTGIPAGPTAAPGTNTTQLATTAFALAAAAAAGVTSFNSRTGPVTLSLADVTGVGGAPLASPTFTGTPAAPTAPANTNTTQLATCAFVTAAIASGTGHVISFNSRQGAITLTTADITAAGGAPIASPVFTGTPQAPTQPPTDSSTNLATTAFVQAANTAASSPIKAYWGGTLNITLLGQNASSWTGTTTNVITFASPHGITGQALVILSGTVPGAMPIAVGQPCYFGALSPTTGAFYNLLSDAKADINRISGGTTTAWSFKTVTYSNVISSGFDPVVPIGAKSATGNIQLELNLSKPLAGLFAIVLMGNTTVARAADGVVANGWYQNVGPTIVSTILLGLYGNWATNAGLAVPSGGGLASSSQGSWTQQGNTAMVLNFVVIG
jgi:hypothetical protein